MGFFEITTETQRTLRAISFLGMVAVWLCLGAVVVGQDDDPSKTRYSMTSSYNAQLSVLILGSIDELDLPEVEKSKEEKIAEHRARLDRLKKFEEDQIEIVIAGVTYETLDDALEDRLSNIASYAIPVKGDESGQFWRSDEGLSETQKLIRQALIDRFEQMRIEKGFSKIYMLDDTIRIITRDQFSKYKCEPQRALSDEERLKKHEQRVRELIELRRKQEAERKNRFDEYNATLVVSDDKPTSSTLSREERLREHEERVRHLIGHR